MPPGFKQRVLRVVQRIPKGRFMTYAQVAKAAGKPRAWRAVGNILNKNKDRQIPCHRVIRADGTVGGYNRGTKKKISLLRKENVVIKNNRVALS